TVAVKLLHAAVPGVRDIKIVFGPERNRSGLLELPGCRAGAPPSGERMEGLVEDLDPIVSEVADENPILAVDGDSPRLLHAARRRDLSPRRDCRACLYRGGGKRRLNGKSARACGPGKARRVCQKNVPARQPPGGCPAQHPTDQDGVGQMLFVSENQDLRMIVNRE